MIHSRFPSHRTLIGAVAFACASLAYGHIRIAPVESAPGAREKYTMRVPNEKKVNSTKVAGEFPEGLDNEFIEFGILGINPKEEKDLAWRFVQYYDDGTTEEFTGPVGSRLPPPVTKLKKADPPATASK